MNDPPPQIKIYLLRLWQDEPDRPWQIMLKSADTDKRHVFRDLAQLMDFLQKQVDVP